LLKDPGVADRAAGHRHAVHAGGLQHVEAILGREQIAAAEHRSPGGVLFHLAQNAWEFVPRNAAARCGRER